MNLFLAGTQGRRYVVEMKISGERSMDLHLAGTMYGNQGHALAELGVLDMNEGEPVDLCLAGGFPCSGSNMGKGIHDYKITERRSSEQSHVIQLAILESFYYADEWTEWVIPRISHFMLDSGAFTFMQGTKGDVDWEEYLQRYIDFINRNDVKLFFELDIDSIVGYERVLELRKKLEEGTGKRCIPVWHISRGKDEFLKMCDEYDYVAVGGIVSREIPPNKYPMFTWLIREAHKRGAKIHGLGFTNLEGMRKYHFDSVDSTAWTTGNRFGAVYEFKDGTMKKHSIPPGSKFKDSRAVAVNNFNEWVKFQDYARSYL